MLYCTALSCSAAVSTDLEFITFVRTAEPPLTSRNIPRCSRAHCRTSSPAGRAQWSVSPAGRTWERRGQRWPRCCRSTSTRRSRARSPIPQLRLHGPQAPQLLTTQSTDRRRPPLRLRRGAALGAALVRQAASFRPSREPRPGPALARSKLSSAAFSRPRSPGLGKVIQKAGLNYVEFLQTKHPTVQAA